MGESPRLKEKREGIPLLIIRIRINIYPTCSYFTSQNCETAMYPSPLIPPPAPRFLELPLLINSDLTVASPDLDRRPPNPQPYLISDPLLASHLFFFLGWI